MMQFHPGLLMKGARSIGAWVSGDIEEAINFSLLCNVTPKVENFRLNKLKMPSKK
jgi:hypothetical protein